MISLVVRKSCRRVGPCATLIPRRSMAGHNKWSKIKRKKEVKDVARAAQFTKVSRAIIAASRACGGDRSNLQLQSAIARAKAMELPKARIEDAVQNPMRDKRSNVDHAFVRYDAMMTFEGTKVACIITALTDNRNRTSSKVKELVRKSGGEMLPSSSHDYFYKHAGVILVENVMEEEALYECALNAGATDIDYNSMLQSAYLTCDSMDLWQLVTALQEQKFETIQFEHQYILKDPVGNVQVTMQGQEDMEKFLDQMDEDEDVTHVFHNVITLVEDQID